LCAVACGPTPAVISDPVARGRATAGQARSEAERLWLERLDEDKLRGAIAAWRRAVAAADDDAASWCGIARASFFLADGILAFDPARREETARTFEEGAAAAERGLRALAPEFERRRRDGSEVDEAAAALGPAAVPLLYWWGQNAIRWADLRGKMAAMRVYKPVLHVMEQVARLDPGYDHGGADRYLGSFYGEAPGIAGGDLEKSRAHFDRAVALAPAYLQTRVALAEHYARPAHDAPLYAAALRLVAETPADAVPDAVPEQEIAKKKAQRLAPAL
jgi:hypothetical protein